MRQSNEGVFFDLKGRAIPADEVVDMATVAKEDMPALVRRVNAQLDGGGGGGGAVVVKLTQDGRGYGLFANRDFERGEEIATYGGMYHGEGMESDVRFKGYVFDVFKGGRVFTYDAGRYFRLGDAGRWINEPPNGEEWLVNVEGRTKRHTLYFVAKRRIYAGEELFLLYGEDYENPWWRWKNVIQSANRDQLERLLRSFEQQIATDFEPLTDVQRTARLVARNEVQKAIYSLGQ